MNETLLRDSIKRPSKPHKIVNVRGIPTEKDIKIRQERINKLKALGIDIATIDDSKESEDTDKLEASLIIMQGKELPKELENRLLKKKEEQDKIDNTKLRNKK